MKRLLAPINILLVGTTVVVNGATTLTFDDLSPGSDWGLVTNGYGGLQWNYFGVLDGSVLPATEGYRIGMISSNNVAFNLAGNPASIIGRTLFNLQSAYLTAHVADGMQIEVQGFAGPTLAYDNTYILSANSPAFIEFNFLGVDQVRFIPSPGSLFVMDNLTVTVTEDAPPHSMVNIGTVQASTIGHIFLKAGTIHHTTTNSVVGDYLVAQDMTLGGGVLPSVAINFDNYNQFALTVSAPAGRKFFVKVPAGTAVGFGGEISWESTGGGLSPAGPVTVSFADVEGTPPDFAESDAVLSDSHGFFGFYDIISTRFTNDLAFSSMTLTGTVVAQHTGLGALNFAPHNASFLVLAYRTLQTNDPGRFVSIIPAGAPHLALSLRADAVMLSWNSETGKSYQARFKQSLADPTWENLGPIHPGTGDRQEQTDGTRDRTRFYQVIEVP
jgi:hypothetical protein